MNRIKKCLMGMLYQRTEILAEYEPGEQIRDAYIEVLNQIHEEWRLDLKRE